MVLVGSYGVIWDSGPSGFMPIPTYEILMILVLSQLYLRTSWALNHLIPTMADKISKPIVLKICRPHADLKNLQPPWVEKSWTLLTLVGLVALVIRCLKFSHGNHHDIIVAKHFRVRRGDQYYFGLASSY